MNNNTHFSFRVGYFFSENPEKLNDIHILIHGKYVIFVPFSPSNIFSVPSLCLLCQIMFLNPIPIISRIFG